MSVVVQPFLLSLPDLKTLPFSVNREKVGFRTYFNQHSTFGQKIYLASTVVVKNIIHTFILADEWSFVFIRVQVSSISCKVPMPKI